MAHVLYFAWLRERIGIDGEDVEALPGETGAGLAARLALRGAGYAAAFADLSRVRCAIDQEMAPLETPLGNASEVAFFPPVTGG